MYKMKEFVITKKVAKHGKQSILVIPKILENELRPGTLVKVSLQIVKESEYEWSSWLGYRNY